MISAALTAITSRKWLMEAILAGVLVAGVYLFCQHLISVGVQRQKDADAKELVKLQHDADVETAKAQARADIAEKARDTEISQLDDYRRLHPLSGRLCLNQGGSHLPTASATEPVPDSASAIPGPIFDLPTGNNSGGIDQLAMLDLLAAKCDGLSSQLREWQARQ